jgi:hypothetical protein
MNTNELSLARQAFAAFERNMAEETAVHDLKEALDYALDIIEDGASSDSDITVATNLINSYAKRLGDEIESIINSHGYYDVDYYSHWGELAHCFEECEIDDGGNLSKARMALMASAFESLSREDKKELIRLLEESKD